MKQVLFNNIELPEDFPPRYSVEILKKGQPVPYLKHPPKVIDITLGRQLFVDDFLISVHTLFFRYHRAVKYPGNPVFSPETVMEKYERLPFAAPKDGAVLYDGDAQKYKMWYEAGWLHKLAYAESDDGIHWERPNLHIVEGTNEIMPQRGIPTAEGFPNNFRPDSTSVVMDAEANPSERYKLYLRNPGLPREAIVAVSPDGIHFENSRFTDVVCDRSTMFYNPFRKKWVHSIRTFRNGERARDYYECDDLTEEAKAEGKAFPWLYADDAMRPNPYIGQKPQLYNFNAVAYESIMVGLFEVLFGPDNEECHRRGVPKITELIPVYSRDGFHFSKPSDCAVVQAGMIEGAWDRGYVQSVGGCFTVHRDELRIYYSGVAGDESKAGMGESTDGADYAMYSGGATGFATLRRDGFVSLYTPDDGRLDTRVLIFHGKKRFFFLNAVTKETGGIVVTVLSGDGNTVLATSGPFCGNSTCAMLDFGDYDLSGLDGVPFRLRFDVTGGELYSFWFSETETGDSGGYTGAGCPEE